MAQTDKLSHTPATNRRNFLKGGVTAAGAAALTGPLAFLKTKALASGHLCGTRGPSPYGELFPAKDDVTGLPLIMLPQGFKYSTFSWRGDLMDDGNVCPSGHDGMAIVRATNPGGQAHGKSQTFTLIRNHEVFGVGSAPIAPDYNYDSQGGGGTTALTWQDGKLIDHHVSISGTISNCAGGPSPWGSWITCEEGVDQGDQPHGYAFECTVERVISPTPLKAMGRFAHEAVAFDPRSGHVFLTEDNSSSSSLEPTPADRRRGNSGFYCFVPHNPLGGVGSLAAGGTLYMLKTIGIGDLRDPACFSEYDVEWVEIERPTRRPACRFPRHTSKAAARARLDSSGWKVAGGMRRKIAWSSWTPRAARSARNKAVRIARREPCGPTIRQPRSLRTSSCRKARLLQTIRRRQPRQLFRQPEWRHHSL